MKTTYNAKLMIYNAQGNPVRTVDETEVEIEHASDEDPFEKAMEAAKKRFKIKRRKKPGFKQHYTVDMFIKR